MKFGLTTWVLLTILTRGLGLILWLGLFPQPVLRRMEPAARTYLERIDNRRATTPAVAVQEGR